MNVLWCPNTDSIASIVPFQKWNKLFIERWKANDLTEKDECANQEFLEVEKEIYLKMYPKIAKLLNEEDLDEHVGIRMKWQLWKVERLHLNLIV